MPTLWISFFLVLLPILGLAQQQETQYSHTNKFYTSIGLTNINFHLYFKSDTFRNRDIRTGSFSPIFLNLGYQWDRASLQAGIAYGWNNSQISGAYLKTANEYIEYHSQSNTKALAIPVSLRIEVLRIFERFPFYGTASLMPSFATTKGSIVETQNGAPFTSFSGQDSGMNVFAMAGFGIHYKNKTRFGGYLEVLPIKTNLSHYDSFHHDWNAYAGLGHRLFRSLGVGVNYDLQ